MIENVRGFLGSVFNEYRTSILQEIKHLSYTPHIKLLNASDYGVPQLRPRTIIVSIRNDLKDTFSFPSSSLEANLTVGDALYDLMSANGWNKVEAWRKLANKRRPSLVAARSMEGPTSVPQEQEGLGRKWE